jgi:hypothetical protein
VVVGEGRRPGSNSFWNPAGSETRAELTVGAPDRTDRRRPASSFAKLIWDLLGECPVDGFFERIADVDLEFFVGHFDVVRLLFERRHELLEFVVGQGILQLPLAIQPRR